MAIPMMIARTRLEGTNMANMMSHSTPPFQPSQRVTARVGMRDESCGVSTTLYFFFISCGVGGVGVGVGVGGVVEHMVLFFLLSFE